ncbi:LysR family transcriptional regulator [Panacagrimonas perspica]|uniref:LysR family transcriptional regulator n=1 Tax=Panacagrimonas perspica TaxID=381431 RepID=A0A4S3K0C5_9GAMM|nr:LysR substrate-binding domain-containing protein [Panacagrimonas perspica]TDU32141.1 LysR family transcriptional regulator [Panacagrimonas perspica]THD01154.1 hypothetical protein B1810_21440 [Panacagrimonas perspica]
MSPDLNDLRFFALVVDHGGFSAAERHAHITKSKLSRRIALLEDRLGVRLLQRSTRRLALTDAGRVFYEHCAAMVVEADAATTAIEQLRSEPSGTVRITAPMVLSQHQLAGLVAEFMRLHPKVRVELDASDRIVNLIEERIDIALRATGSSHAEPGLVARRVTSGRRVMVASAGYFANRALVIEPGQITRDGHDTIGTLAEGAEQTWALTAADGRDLRLTHRPRLLCSNFVVQYEAALGGVGIAFLPLRQVWQALHDGRLLRAAKDWGTSERDIHLLFASRRGMLPAVRAMVDFLVARIPAAMAEY